MAVEKERNLSVTSNAEKNLWPAAKEAVEDGATDLAHMAKETAVNAGHKAQEFGKQAMDQTTTVVRRYPLQSLFAFLGVGFIAGIILSRRRV